MPGKNASEVDKFEFSQAPSAKDFRDHLNEIVDALNILIRKQRKGADSFRALVTRDDELWSADIRGVLLSRIPTTDE